MPPILRASCSVVLVSYYDTRNVDVLEPSLNGWQQGHMSCYRKNPAMALRIAMAAKDTSR